MLGYLPPLNRAMRAPTMHPDNPAPIKNNLKFINTGPGIVGLLFAIVGDGLARVPQLGSFENFKSFLLVQG
jgi:hypothetical protein